MSSGINPNQYDNVEHARILATLCGTWHDQEAVKEIREAPRDRVPHSGCLRNNAARWAEAGAQTVEVSDGLEAALRNLTEKDGGWKGKAAESFTKAVREIVRFAREYAHTCDEIHPKPQKDDGNDSNFKEPPPAQKSIKQTMHSIADAIDAAQRDGRLPPPPWWTEPMWIKGYRLYYYEIRKGGGEGSVVPQTNWGEDDIKKMYANAGIQTAEYASDSNDSSYTFPKEGRDYDKFFFHKNLNQEQEKVSRDTARELFTAYDRAWNDLPEAPKDLTMPFADKDPGSFGGAGAGAGGGGAAGGGAGAGAGGAGAMGGGAANGMPGMGGAGAGRPPGAGSPDMSRSPVEPSRPDPGRTPDPTKPPGIDPRTPGPHDPAYNPRDPHRTGYDPGKIDSGTEGARVGTLDPNGTGRIGPAAGIPPGGAAGGVGPGGAFGGTIPAGSAGSSGPGGSGAGLGAAGAAGAGARGGAGAGMMPMGMGGAGAGQGGDGTDQERATWLEEDENVWGDNADVPPPVLGGGF